VRGERTLTIPVLAVGAEGGGGSTMLDTMRLVAADVRGSLFAGCGHYVAEEAPQAPRHPRAISLTALRVANEPPSERASGKHRPT
jgi:hypothetical protein